MGDYGLVSLAQSQAETKFLGTNLGTGGKSAPISNDESIMTLNSSQSTTIGNEQTQSAIEQITNLFSSFITALQGILTGNNTTATNSTNEVQNGNNKAETPNDTYKINGDSSFRETRNYLLKHFNSIGLHVNKGAKIDESAVVDDTNKQEYLNYYNITGADAVAEFDKYYSKYDCVSLVTSSGIEILRFVDSTGKPVMEYDYGYEYEDDNSKRTRTIYEYSADGSYTTKQTAQTICNGDFFNYGTYIPPRRFSKGDQLLNGSKQRP